MKDFFKFTLATITGIILTSIVMFVISIIVVFSMLSSTETETVVKKNSIMMLDLNGSLVERTSDNIFKELFDKDPVIVEKLAEGSNWLAGKAKEFLQSVA